QVLATPEGGPADSDAPVPPTWHEHMQGPILGLDDRPRPGAPPANAAASASPPAAEAPSPDQQAAPESPAAAAPIPFPGEARTADDEKELSKWPAYRGKPVSDVGEALKYAAPIAAQA